MAVSAVSTAAASSSSATTGANSLGPDEFMTLLITELRMQDPMSPMDTQGLVQQLSQMEMVSETRMARQSQDFSQALAMIGRTATWQDATTGEVQSGAISGVVRNGSDAQVMVGGAKLSLDEITSVS